MRVPVAAARTGVRVGFGVAGWAERQALGLLGTRLDRARGEAPKALTPGSGAPSSGRGPAEPEALGPRMRSLLDQALANTPQDTSVDLYHRILDQLNPDEARILGALSDGHVEPLVHVRPLSPAGILGEPTLENASLVGKMANVSLPHLTPQYVTHLLSLGLLQVGAERSSLKEEYQILMADSGVLKATKKASRGPIAARVEKHTVRLSPLGLALWQACFPEKAP